MPVRLGTAETNIDGKTHAWFIAYAPSTDPEIVSTVLVERGGEGSVVAGPIARSIFDFWFHKTKIEKTTPSPVAMPNLKPGATPILFPSKLKYAFFG